MSRGTAEATAYLAEAIAILKARHLNSGEADWPRLEARARIIAEGATTSAETYPAIRELIVSLKQRHTSFWTPEFRRRSQGGETPQTSETPSGEMIGGIGWVTLPGFTGRGQRAANYAVAGRGIVSRLDANGVSGWIIDLRSNTGGNMWPMLNAIAGLLGEPPFGAFVRPDGRRDPWTVREGRICAGDQPPRPVSQPWDPLDNGAAPLAILLGPATASSGEMTALALIGRPDTRVFGLPTSGLVTGNSLVVLSDGAGINLTSCWGEDRTGRRYPDRIFPDEVSATSQEALDAALAWLRSKGC